MKAQAHTNYTEAAPVYSLRNRVVFTKQNMEILKLGVITPSPEYEVWAHKIFVVSYNMFRHIKP
jgi:hypothetical protein